jgi:hypothetical protein
MKVGLWSHNLMSGVVREPSHAATSDSVVGRRAKLLNGFIKNNHWQAGLQLPFRVAHHPTTCDAAWQASFSSEAVQPTEIGVLLRN